MNPQKNSKGKNNKGRGARVNKVVALLVLFCVCIGGISMVSAKYIKQRDLDDNSAKAQEFYFESDLLDGGEHEIVATKDAVGNVTGSVTIRLKNYVDELRFSETEIVYDVSVKKTDTNTDTDTLLPASSIQNKSGTIAAGSKQKQDVTISNLEPGKTYLVTAVTDNIYKKTLQGTIKVLAPDENVNAAVNDQTEYIEVTVWTTDYTGEVTLNYGNIGLIPDNTNAKMRGASSTGGRISESNWEANTSYVFRFFKTDTDQKYDVAVSGTEVTVSETK